MTVIQWAQPALLWDKTQPMDQRKKPQLLQLTSDEFLPEFLDAMNAEPDKVLGSNPVALNFLNTKKMADSTTTPLKLYQPLHSRYYLVTASLVCQQVGLPDKDVDLKKGEKTFFVIRRTQGGVEQGWSDKRGWITISNNGSAVEADEERLPAHPVSVCTGEENNLVSCKRKIYYGYIPTGNREKYLDKQVVTATTSIPEENIKKFFEDANKEDNKARPANKQVPVDYRFDIFDTKVIASWKFLTDNRSQPKVTQAAREQASLEILLDLTDTVKNIFPTVWGAIQKRQTNPFDAASKRYALYDLLEKKVSKDTKDTVLREIMADLESYLPLVNGQDGPEPTSIFDVSNFVSPDALKNAVQDLLATSEEKSLANIDPANDERARLIGNQARPVPVAGAEDSYFLRMIYDYDPECPPIPSDPSSKFTIARNLEPDAPARLIRIEMPSIKPRDLRKFRHGVGMQMSPELRKVMDGVHKDMLKGEGLNDVAGWELGMICTFSIQIITLIAFVVMFIFAILLNIVFWWLAFLKICLPIPKST